MLNLSRAVGSTGSLAAVVAVVGLIVGCAVAADLDADQPNAAPVSADDARASSAPAPARTAVLAEARREQPFDFFGGLRFDDAIPSPLDFFGYEIGDRFTHHADNAAYLKELARASDRVRIQQYGRTHQGRALHLLTISSPENLRNLDRILAANRELTDPRTLDDARARRIIENNPAIVWFSYNVHGNEASCSEAAMQVAYTMAAARNEEIRGILDNVVLFIDPMLNPDGRERYVSFFENTVAASGPNPSPDAAEHDEPWPGGRTNHYLFDLNRDWLWLVHPESQGRLAAFKPRRPQLHIDFHEQGYLSPYFFGAGEDPYNTNIPQETRDWIERYGAANAEVFDEDGLVYATRERFDYLYPGYGKVLPVYHGAVGMLVEKAGHGFAGLAVEVSDQYTLTLRERARHHFLTSMSYLETTAANREGQLERFARFFEESMTPGSDDPRAFLISADNDPSLLEKVWTICAAHGIEIDALDDETTLTGLASYRTGESLSSVTLPEGSWIIPSGQPMGRLARALFERATEVTDNETYDITGWSLPISFGLNAWYATRAVRAPATRLDEWRRPEPRIAGSGDVAILIDAAQHHFPRTVGLAIKHDLFARRTGAPIEAEGRHFETGSLLVHRVRNEDRDLDAFLEEVRAAGLDAQLTDTGMTQRGHVLGANDNELFTNPKILVLRGAPLSSYSFGQVWHLLDQEARIPHTNVNIDALSRIRLSEYDVIVIPEAWGSLGESLGDRNVERIREWTREGGLIVAIGRTARWTDQTILELDSDEPEDDAAGEDEPDLTELTWAERRQRRQENALPAPMTKAEVDVTHPLAAGVREWVGVLKRNDEPLGVGEEGFVVARFEPDPYVGGIMSDENREKFGGTPFMTHHALGRGAVVAISDDVTIRGFMHGPMRLLLNAIIFGPSL